MENCYAGYDVPGIILDGDGFSDSVSLGRQQEIMSILTPHFIEDFKKRFWDAVSALDDNKSIYDRENDWINVSKQFAEELRRVGVLKDDEEVKDAADIFAEDIGEANGDC